MTDIAVQRLASQQPLPNLKRILRYNDLYRKILDAIERRIDQEAVINNMVLAEDVGTSDTSLSVVLVQHPQLIRLIYQCQRVNGYRRPYGSRI